MHTKIRINIVSESDVSVQGHGVHTAYVEMVNALMARTDTDVIAGEFNKQVDCDIIHLHTVGPRVWSKLWQKGPKKVMSAHVVPDSFVGSLVFAKYWRFLAVWYLRFIYNRVDLLLAVSEETKRDLHLLKVKPPVEVLHNFIDTSRYRAPSISREDIRTKLGIPLDTFVVIGAGQVQPRKRVDEFITAAAALPDVYFVWIGGMPFGKAAADSAHLERMMKAAPKNALFPGIVPLEDMPAYYRASDLFWLPSIQETFGLVVVEAAAAGLPVMLRDIPDYKETFYGDSLLGSTSEQFHKNIITLRDNLAEREQWTEAASRISQRFDSKESAARLVKLYKKLI